MKQCPFCKTTKEFIEVTQNFVANDGLYAVLCNGCGALGPRGATEITAEILWDNRSDDATNYYEE